MGYCRRQHEPIIDKEIWDIVQDKVGRKVNFGASHEPNIFARIARCADCGWSMGLTPKQIDFKTKKRIETNSQSFDNAAKWIELIKQYSNIQEIDSIIVNELVEKILIHEAKMDLCQYLRHKKLNFL